MNSFNVAVRVAALALLVFLAGCGRAPESLQGFWSRSEKACAAGLGVTFRPDSVRARYEAEAFTLLADPIYRVAPSGQGRIVTISYRLPRAPGGVSPALGRGVLTLEWRPEGRLLPIRHHFTDLRTGSARIALEPGAVERAFTLGRCPDRKPR